MNEEIEKILNMALAATEPSRMTASAALDFMVELRDELDMRIEALKNDMERAGETEN